jgi:hypothetical protein
VECDADLLFLAPDRVATTHEMVGFDDEREICGMPTGLATSIRAPLDEMLRTVQSIPPPPSNARVPRLSTLCLYAFRLSIIVELRNSQCSPSRIAKRNYA